MSSHSFAAAAGRLFQVRSWPLGAAALDTHSASTLLLRLGFCEHVPRASSAPAVFHVLSLRFLELHFCKALLFTPNLFRKPCVIVFGPGAAGESFLSTAGLPRPPTRGGLCAACSQARRRACCAVQRCDAGRRALERRAARGGFSHGLFRQAPVCFVQVARRPALSREGRKFTACGTRGVGSFPRSDRTDRLALSEKGRQGQSRLVEVRCARNSQTRPCASLNVPFALRQFPA